MGADLSWKRNDGDRERQTEIVVTRIDAKGHRARPGHRSDPHERRTGDYESVTGSVLSCASSPKAPTRLLKNLIRGM